MNATAAQKESGRDVAVRSAAPALPAILKDLGVLQRSPEGVQIIDLTDPRLQEHFNVLAPSSMIARSDPNFTPAVFVVQLDPDHINGSDFYVMEWHDPRTKKDPKYLALTKTALHKIGAKAGIEDSPASIGHWGDRKENLTVTCESRARRPDGTFLTLSGSREWIEEDEKEILKSSPPEWATKSESAFNKWWADNWFGRVKKHRLAMTESKARLRAYRDFLTVKSKYTPQEAAKGFLIVSTTFTPDTSNPEILRMVFTGGERAANLLYGPAANEEIDTIDGHAFEHGDLPEGVDPETGEVFEGTAAEEEPQGHGPRPTEDPVLPSGPHEGKPVSEAARVDPDYVKKYLVGSSSAKWGTAAEQWLKYWHGEGGEDDIEF